MQAPYQIKRWLDFLPSRTGKPVYIYNLVDGRTGNIVRQVYATSIVPPVELRKTQALLNTRAMLDC